jgi:hypothetical protein
MYSRPPSPPSVSECTPPALESAFRLATFEPAPIPHRMHRPSLHPRRVRAFDSRCADASPPSSSSSDSEGDGGSFFGELPVPEDDVWSEPERESVPQTEELGDVALRIEDGWESRADNALVPEIGDERILETSHADDSERAPRPSNTSSAETPSEEYYRPGARQPALEAHDSDRTLTDNTSVLGHDSEPAKALQQLRELTAYFDGLKRSFMLPEQVFVDIARADTGERLARLKFATCSFSALDVVRADPPHLRARVADDSDYTCAIGAHQAHLLVLSAVLLDLPLEGCDDEKRGRLVRRVEEEIDKLGGWRDMAVATALRKEGPAWRI